MDSLAEVDAPAREIVFESHRRLPYDVLVVAIGARAVPAIEFATKVRADKASGIVNAPNTYSADPRYIVDLLKRVITVSLETLDVGDQLHAAEVGIVAA